MTVEKTYEDIVKELQQQIDDRKAADHGAAMKSATSAELEKLGYHSGNLDNALAVLEPFYSRMEGETAAKDEALKLHDLVMGRTGSAHKPKNSVFK